MIETETSLIAEGTIRYHGSMGWTVQETPDPQRWNDKGVRSAATLLTPLKGQRARVTVTVGEPPTAPPVGALAAIAPAPVVASARESRKAEGQIDFVAATWVVREEAGPKSLTDLFQWAVGQWAKVTVERIG